MEIKKIVEGFDITDNSAQGIATHAETTDEIYDNNNNHDLHLAHSEGEVDEEYKKKKKYY